MKATGLLKLGLISSLFLALVIAYGCASDDEMYSMPDCKTDYMYLKLCSTPRTSLLTNLHNISNKTKRSLTGKMPALTKADLNYMASLSWKEFDTLTKRAHRLISDDDKVTLSEIQDRNLLNSYLVMGGATGVEVFKDFAKVYLHTEGGLEALKANLPKNLTDAQSVYYVAMAMYVDNIVRPTLRAIFDADLNDKDIVTSQEAFEAENRIIMLGINLCVDVLVDIISDYSDMQSEELITLGTFAEITNIWHIYNNAVYEIPY